jgi:hypothetical protein
MPLFANSRPAYVRRRRVFVDSDLRDMTRSASEFDFVFPLRAALQNVVSIELVDYSVKRDLQQTFVAAGGGFPGNNVIDVYINDVATETHPLYYTVTIPPRDYTRTAELAAALQVLLNAGMAATGDAFWATESWTVGVRSTAQVGVGEDSQNNLTFDILLEGSHISQFLFKTGPSARDNASVPLGFFEGSDSNLPFRTIGTGALFTSPFTNQVAKLAPFRFMDVRIAQAPELSPVGRVSLFENADTGSKTEIMDSRPRMLTQPLRRLDELRVVCTIGSERRPPLSRSRGGVDLVFDVLEVSQEQDVPGWMQQDFVY